MPLSPLPKARAKLYAREYIKNGGNATQMVKTIKPALTVESASVAGTRVLQNPVFQSEIRQVLEDNDVTDELLSKTLLRNVKEKRDSISNGAIDIVNRMKGNYASEKKEELKITLTGKELNDAIQAQIALLKEMQTHQDGSGELKSN